MITKYITARAIIMALKTNRYLKCLIYPLPEKYGLGVHTVIQFDGSVSFGPNAYYVDKLDYSI